MGRRSIRIKGELHPVLPLTQGEFDALLEYSASLPTGVIIGKRWKRYVRRLKEDPAQVADLLNWRIGKYTRESVDYPGEVDITWYFPEIVEAAP